MKVDVNDLNFHAFDENIKLGYNEARYKINGWKIGLTLLILIGKGLASVYYFFLPRYDKNDVACEVAMFAFSEANNERCLRPLLPSISNSKLFTNENLKLKRIWIYSMLYAPIVLFRCFTYTGKKQRFYCRFFLSFCKAYGTYIEAISILKNLQPKMIIVANDHSYTSRSFFRAAQHLKIITAYVQHASVNKFFPPLEFDYAFLDGLESYEKYLDGKTCSSSVFLSGNPRFDILSTLTSHVFQQHERKIGIAVNPLDSLDIIKELIISIKAKIKGVEISLRPHPSSDMRYWAEICRHMDCKLSNSFLENPFLFINRHQVFIARNSSFHLDVCMAGKKSFFFNFSGKPVMDAYNYLKNNLVEDITPAPVEAINVALKTSSNKVLNKQAQYFVGNFNTIHWGMSAKLIGTTVIEILEGKRDLSFWTNSVGAKVFKIEDGTCRLLVEDETSI